MFKSGWYVVQVLFFLTDEMVEAIKRISNRTFSDVFLCRSQRFPVSRKPVCFRRRNANVREQSHKYQLQSKETSDAKL